MREWMGRRGWILGMGMVVGLAAPVGARQAESSYLEGSSRKLGRGISNAITFPFELIRTPTLVGRRDGNVAALSVGVVQGVTRAVLRGLAGLFEVATFYVEIPKGFGPLMKPEFVWHHGDWVE